MLNLLSNIANLFKNFANLLLKTYQSVMFCYFNTVKKNMIYLNNIFNFLLSSTFTIDLSGLEGLFLNQMLSSVEYIKVQELTFLSEYFLITALFCLTLFALFSLKLVVDEEHFLIKFQYNNQLTFLLIFVLSCYLILVYQQMNISLLALTSFNDTIYNDQLSFISKLIIGVSSILYLIFITQYLKDQKLSNFEYYIILLTSIFGFFLLCGANDLITAYLAIELQGLAFYVLASFKKSSNFSIESGVKYFVLGSLSTALFLLGVTFIYGLSGSVILTDYKDFFIWIFSTNSFFLSFDSIYKALEIFQEKTDVANDNYISNLQIISDKLDLLKKKVFFLAFDTEFFKPILNDFNTQTESLNQIEFCKNISVKMGETFNQIDSTSILGYQDFTNNIDFFKTNILAVFSHNDFLIENITENALIDLIYVSPENQLIEYESFVQLKNNSVEASFYEIADLNPSLSVEKLSSYLSQVDSTVSLNSYLNFMQNYEILCLLEQKIDSGDSLEKKLPEFTILSSNNLLTSDSKSYLFAIFNIVNNSNFFLEPSNLNSLKYQFMFDFSFAVSGMIIIILALFFKLALAPFHLWAPDVYEGSPSSSTFFFMVISKFSIFVFLLRICYLSFYSLISYWQFYSLIVATISIFIGAVAGLKQRRLKSLLTYSSINNMGFVLLAFSVGSFEGIQVKFYYLIVYMIASLCIWSIILNLKLKKKFYSEKQNRDLGDLALLQESNNVVAQSLAITLFTLAGLPPMVGFLAKMGVFKALTGVSIYFFSVVNILFSVVSTFYYLRIVKIIFFENILIGNLYETISTKKTFLINLLTFFLVFLFISPMFLYLYSYKITLFLNKAFY
uniref:NADH dehydrogenase subunit 2 n=1 Tax=Navicula veneta TaxID=138539 RepID=A0A8F0WIR9_9STRA|nr:NADH dehydrogenase subunit 2 [Navicula veneta]QWM93656.1 NADH dehydrogenase subunit 2 [Navicula veneta]